MFFRRGVSGDPRWLNARLWLFSVGALLALVGMATGIDRLVAVAGLVLALGIALRFLPARSTGDHRPPSRDDDPRASGDSAD